jgi:hypothetical protein
MNVPVWTVVLSLVNLAIMSVLFTIVLVIWHGLGHFRKVGGEIDAASRALISMIASRSKAVTPSERGSSRTAASDTATAEDDQQKLA